MIGVGPDLDRALSAGCWMPSADFSTTSGRSLTCRMNWRLDFEYDDAAIEATHPGSRAHFGAGQGDIAAPRRLFASLGSLTSWRSGRKQVLHHWEHDTDGLLGCAMTGSGISGGTVQSRSQLAG